MTGDLIVSQSCTTTEFTAPSKTVKDASVKSRRIMSRGESLELVLGEPRRLRKQLEDELRGQGSEVRKMLNRAWIGKCTDCSKYKCGICWANKNEVYNPISPGKEGVCTLKRPDGSFKTRGPKK